ncbi:sugar phosphate isomerase/epimerase family protein [Zobellella sp. DQSA1]|uniref:sugar phosphate isomerase/epimerase family protein n=1 Tax=Zobellella sp. DQSA1 TaxID=3342386 RepID=UPI0035C1EB8C
MKIGLVTDSLSHLAFDDLLGTAAELGLDCLEFATGNWSSAPHIDIDKLLDSPAQMREFKARIEAHGLTISALNANGNPLHPGASGPGEAAVVDKTIELASRMGVERVNLMSGLPGAPGDKHPNWIVSAWPPETGKILEWQWQEVVLPYWQQLVKTANGRGINKLCLEMHGGQVVYNAASFRRLREAVGATVGLNFDPSHLLWMGADPLAVIRELGDSIYHVHAKDTWINPQPCALNSRLEILHHSQVAQRSWSYVTLGYGQSELWWRQFCYELRLAGYDDVLSIEHEDMTLSRYEGVKKSVELLQRCMPVEVSDYELPPI